MIIPIHVFRKFGLLSYYFFHKIFSKMVKNLNINGHWSLFKNNLSTIFHTKFRKIRALASNKSSQKYHYLFSWWLIVKTAHKKYPKFAAIIAVTISQYQGIIFISPFIRFFLDYKATVSYNHWSPIVHHLRTKKKKRARNGPFTCYV